MQDPFHAPKGVHQTQERIVGGLGGECIKHDAAVGRRTQLMPGTGWLKDSQASRRFRHTSAGLITQEQQGAVSAGPT